MSCLSQENSPLAGSWREKELYALEGVERSQTLEGVERRIPSERSSSSSQ